MKGSTCTQGPFPSEADEDIKRYVEKEEFSGKKRFYIHENNSRRN